MKGYLSDEDYSFIYSKSTRACVDLVICNGPDVLLIKRDIEPYKGDWHLPGGRIRFREKIEDAINRIVQDEVGASVSSFNFLGYMEFLEEVQGGEERHTVSIVFSVTVINAPQNGEYFNEAPNNIIPEHKIFLQENKIL